RRCELLIHVIGNEIVTLENIAESAADILQDLCKLHRRDGFQIRHGARTFEAKENVTRVIGEQRVGVKKIRTAERIKHGPILGPWNFQLWDAPIIHYGNSASHLTPLSGHPFLMLGKGL